MYTVPGNMVVGGALNALRPDGDRPALPGDLLRVSALPINIDFIMYSIMCVARTADQRRPCVCLVLRVISSRLVFWCVCVCVPRCTLLCRVSGTMTAGPRLSTANSSTHPRTRCLRWCSSFSGTQACTHRSSNSSNSSSRSRSRLLRRRWRRRRAIARPAPMCRRCLRRGGRRRRRRCLGLALREGRLRRCVVCPVPSGCRLARGFACGNRAGLTKSGLACLLQHMLACGWRFCRRRFCLGCCCCRVVSCRHLQHSGVVFPYGD